MNFGIVWAIVLRHLRLFSRDANRLIVLLYWPLFEVVLWGSLGIWVQQNQNSVQDLSTVFLMGIVLWQVVTRSCFEMTTLLLEEIWSSSLVNFFASPLRLSEWLTAGIILSFLMSSMFTAYYILLVILFYGFSFAKTMAVMLIFGPSLFISGIWLGLLSLPFIISFGRRAQELVYIVGWFAGPLCGAFYPIEVLPVWAQKISYCLPMTYAFEGMRSLLLHDLIAYSRITASFVLGIFYCIISLALFVYCFYISKKKGFSRLTN